MLRNRRFWFFVATWFVASAQAQGISVNLPEKEIVAEPADAPKAVFSKTVKPDQVRLSTGLGMGSELARLTGAYLRAHGPGLLGSFSYRGSGPERTLVVWDGIPVNGWNTGQADLNLFPWQPNSTVNLYSGAGAAHFGSGAVGAVLAVQPQIPSASGPAFRIHGASGSFGLLNGNVDFSWTGEGWHLYVQAMHNQAENDFSYTNYAQPGKPVEKMQHASYRISGAQWQIGKTYERGQIRFSGWYHQAQRDIPAVIGAAWNNAVQKDASLRQSISWQHQWLARISSFIQLAHTLDWLDFSDLQQQDSSTVHGLYAKGELHWQILPKLQLKTGLHWQHLRAYLSAYNQGLAIENRPAAFLSLQWKKWGEWEFRFREQWTTNMPSIPVFSAGHQINIFRKNETVLGLRTMFAAHFRVPTLNDRYWQPGGNPNLRPEKGFQAELGFTGSGRKGPYHWNLFLNAYYSQITDYIRWLPFTNTFWKPDNISLARLYGSEAGFQAGRHFNSFQTDFSLRINWNRALDEEAGNLQMIYTPEITGYSSLELGYRICKLKLGAEYTGPRFTQTDNQHSLPGFFMLHAQISAAIRHKKWEWQPFVSIENLNNAEYQWIRNRPMPGTNFRAGLNLSWNHNK